ATPSRTPAAAAGDSNVLAGREAVEVDLEIACRIRGERQPLPVGRHARICLVELRSDHQLRAARRGEWHAEDVAAPLRIALMVVHGRTVRRERTAELKTGIGQDVLSRAAGELVPYQAGQVPRCCAIDER